MTPEQDKYVRVTKLLKSVGIINDAFYTKDGAKRGGDIHKVLEDIDRNQMPIIETEVDVRYAGWVEAYLDFKEKYTPRFTAIEQPVVSEALRCRGTPDRICILHPPNDMDRPCILDIKTGQKQEWNAVQLCGYRRLVGEDGFKLYALFLKPNGKYRLLDVATDFRYRESYYDMIFKSALNIYYWGK